MNIITNVNETIIMSAFVYGSFYIFATSLKEFQLGNATKNKNIFLMNSCIGFTSGSILLFIFYKHFILK